MSHSPPAQCPDCTWAVHAVVGRVDTVLLVPRRRWLFWSERTEQSGPLCKCARCGCEFYCAQGQTHRWQAGTDKRVNTNSHYESAPSNGRPVLDRESVARIIAEQNGSLGGLKAPDE